MILNAYSGGANGSDHQWEVIGREIIKDPHILNFTHYYHGKKTPYGTRHISEQDYHDGVNAVHRANKTLKRETKMFMSLLARNYVPIREADTVFAIVESIPKHSPGKKHVSINGGTGWSIQMAQDMGKTVYLFDQTVNQWKEFEQGWGWCKCTCPILTPGFAAIGTRALKEGGRKAIADIYHKTLLSWSKNPQSP